MRNPPWHRDEIILALELYFRLKPGQIHARNPEIIELSELLNKLPIHEIRPNSEKFRNPNGASLKLSNFLALDETYEGKGMEAYSFLDAKVFNEFKDNKESLKAIAASIKAIVQDERISYNLYQMGEDESESFEVKEGRVLYKFHKYRERAGKLVWKKKQQVFSKTGKLECEVCKFDFFGFYGKIGEGYIECHHKSPLAKYSVEYKTKLSDLALVCSNCHRMLHRDIGVLTLEGLRLRVERNNYKL